MTKNIPDDEVQKYCDQVLVHTVSHANVPMPNEVCRLIMFCYISLIMYLLSVLDTTNEYVLLYHCKSGQDRTGTFCTINQMVNEITRKYYTKIEIDINANMSFIELYNKYFSVKPVAKPQESTAESQQSTAEQPSQDELYAIIYKHMLFSYYVTFTSTGFPGIKWKLGTFTENRFPYLLLRNAEDASAFEGAAMLRGS